MAYEQPDNSITLWPSKYYKEGGKSPLLTGRGMVDGVMYEVAAWKYVSDKGSRMSIKLTPKDEADAQRAAREAAKQGSEGTAGSGRTYQEDIPF